MRYLTGEKRHSLCNRAIPVAILVLVIVMRLVYLSADTPLRHSSSAGMYVDEGYKTLSARNMVLYGDYHWNPEDDYHGWHQSSPAMNFLYEMSFRIGNVSITSCRIVTIIFFSLLLAMFLFFLRDYPPLLLCVGLLLMGLENDVFFYSRIALLEIPIAVGLYITLLSLKDVENDIYVLALLMVSTAIFAFGFKLSSLLYFSPLFVATLLTAASRHRKTLNRYHLCGATIVAALLVLFALPYAEAFYPRIVNTSLESWWESFLTSPLFVNSSQFVGVGTMCLIVMLCNRPLSLLENRYRLALVLNVVCLSLLLPLFQYNPLRYYVPILPAFVLIIVECLSSVRDLPRPTTSLQVAQKSLCLAACLGIMVMMLGCLQWPSINKLVPLLATALSFVFIVFFYRHRVVHFSIICVLLVGLVLAGYESIIALAGFFRHPHFQSDAIRKELTARISPEESVAGDWAPFLTLGTGVKALYTSRAYNSADRLLRYRPSHLLLSQTPDDLNFFNKIKSQKGVALGEPIRLPNYNKSSIMLFPLIYSLP